jgi:hypothetical protein
VLPYYLTDLVLTVSTERRPITVPHFDSVPVKKICAQEMMSTKIITHNSQISVHIWVEG